MFFSKFYFFNFLQSDIGFESKKWMDSLSLDINSGYPGRSKNYNLFLSVVAEIIEQSWFTGPSFTGNKNIFIGIF